VPIFSQSYLTGCSLVPSCLQQPAPEQVCAQFSSVGPASEAFPQFDSMTACNLKDSRTTLMLRNLPNDYTQAMVLELLESKGFGSNTFNFFYLPIDFQTRVALGYAFIDLAHPSLVQPFWEALDGFSDWVVRSGKVRWVAGASQARAWRCTSSATGTAPSCTTRCPTSTSPCSWRMVAVYPSPNPPNRSRRRDS